MQWIGQAVFRRWLPVGIGPFGLLHPQFELGLVRVEAHRRGGIGAADPALTDRQPGAAIQGPGIDQTPSLIPIAALRRRRTLDAGVTA